MNYQELLQKRAKFIEGARAILDEVELHGREMTPSEREKYNLYIERARELKPQIEAAEKQREEERTMASLTRAKELHKGIALRSTDKLTDSLGLTGEERQIADTFDMGKAVRGIVSGRWEGSELEKRVMDSGTPSAGGYLLPLPVSSMIIDTARNRSVCVGLGAQTVPMTTGKLVMAKIDTDPSVYWRGENEAITEDEDMGIGAMSFSAKSVGALVRCSIELIEDAPNAGQLIIDAISGALGAEMDRVGLFGTGLFDQPKGILHTTGISTVDMDGDGAPLVGYGNFVKAAGKVLEANGKPTGFVFAPRTWVDLQNSLSGEGQFIEIPPGIANMKFEVSNQVPIDMAYGTGTPAADASVIVAGGWENLFYGMRTQVVIEASRVADANTFAKMQVLIRGYLRLDVQIARPAQFAVVKGLIATA